MAGFSSIKELLNRLEILITGRVQGVGFRPHVYRVAKTLDLTGWVQNTALGVLIEIQGSSAPHFLSNLISSLPPLAKIDSIQTKMIACCDNETTFQIIASVDGASRTMISPDTNSCDDCLRELFDPQSRFYHYPFLNCTHCGPRLTITRNLPYDRNQTSMDAFPLCSQCNNDYLDPTNRRYHAQPTACSRCGPQLSLSVSAIAEALSVGKIIAVKGLGGYQLLCNARNESAILTLRKRKGRAAKPFALMVVNCKSAELLVAVDQHAHPLLISQARPIVLLKKTDETLSQSIAPGLSHLGIMLPSTPLHYLLFHALAGYPEGTDWLDEAQSITLVVTSANPCGNPLIIDDEAARIELSSIADEVVSYNRQIVTRADDSVVRIINNAPAFIRRARGYVPKRIKLPYSIPPTLALGGQLKNTFCITRNNEAFVSQHMGNLNNKASIEFFHESLTHWLSFLDVKVERIACDMHPDIYTSQCALEFNLPITTVQHHHAHLASVAAEHHILEPALGLALDGYGYGTDSNAWGGELFLLNHTNAKRLGSLLPIPQPGGDVAAREPWRMAASVLHALGKNSDIAIRFANQPQATRLTKLFKSNSPMPLTSSCGRLFDAASALLGINTISHYEGHAASQLESLVTGPKVLPNGWSIHNNQFSLLPMFLKLLDVDPVSGANLFHGTLIAGLAEWILFWSKKVSSQVVLLSGGCFLNKVLSEGLSLQLAQQGLKVYLPQRLPPNDGGLSLGQAWVAGRVAS
jgi:hydrogenase maturation protein HypF